MNRRRRRAGRPGDRADGERREDGKERAHDGAAPNEEGEHGNGREERGEEDDCLQVARAATAASANTA